MGEVIFNSFIIILVVVWVLIQKNETCPTFNFQRWLTVFVGYYGFDLVWIFMAYHSLLKYRRESLYIMGIRFLFSFFIVGWLVYGNIWFYKDEVKTPCKNNSLYLCMQLVIIYGYYEMLKCCCFSTCACIMAPILFYSYRRA